MAADAASAASIACVRNHVSAMPQRFISLLLIFALALQAALVAPVSAAIHADTNAAASHMGSTQVDLSQMDHADCADKQADTPAGKTDCPCCPDAASSAAGCASFCIAALAVFPGELSFAADCGATYAPMSPQFLLTRSDIPPTPPPKA